MNIRIYNLRVIIMGINEGYFNGLGNKKRREGVGKSSV